MDLKALATGLTLAFVVVIIDAVFHFHYVYVLVMITAVGYGFVRSRQTKPQQRVRSGSIPAWVTLLASGELSDEERIILAQELDTLEPDTCSTVPVTGLLEDLNARLAKPVSAVTKQPIPLLPEPFLQNLTAFIRTLDIRSDLSVQQWQPGRYPFTIVTIQVNRKIPVNEDPQKTVFARLKQDLQSAGGTAWITFPPRKTAIHLAIPGS